MEDLYFASLSLLSTVQQRNRPHLRHDDDYRRRRRRRCRRRCRPHQQCKTTVDVYSDFNYRKKRSILFSVWYHSKITTRWRQQFFFFSFFSFFSSPCYSSRNMKNRRLATIWLSKWSFGERQGTREEMLLRLCWICISLSSVDVLVLFGSADVRHT